MKCGDCGYTLPALDGFPKKVFCKHYKLHMSNKADASRCDYFEKKPTTNADRIRSMTDEELAHFIDKFWSAPWCPDEPPIDSETKECMMHEGKCELCILDWLKQEVGNGE